MGAWKSVARRGAGGYPAGIMKKRKAIVVRNTRETQIRVELDVDGSGRSAIETGLPFFNHMLELLAKHSLMDLTIRAKGDLAVDYHHTVEDVGLALGDDGKVRALVAALGGGFWTWWFWLGVAGLGLIVPMLLKPWVNRSSGIPAVLAACGASLVGVLMLRFFILYAGQLTVA